MVIASIGLAAVAVLLAWPVPIVLAGAAWPSRAPVRALLLWQVIALAGGLSMIGALLLFGLGPFGATPWQAVSSLLRVVTGSPIPGGLDLFALLALCCAVLLGGHLLLNLAVTVVSTERQRRRHRQLVELLGSPSPDRPHTRVLDSAAPVAYCLPGSLHSVTVLSAGLLALLDDNELRAVIEHEKAHLDQRHYVVLMAFDAWRASLPWFPIASRAQREVGLLVEMLADDRARRVVDDRTLATAIALVAGVGEVGAPDGRQRREPARLPFREPGGPPQRDVTVSRISRLSLPRAAR